ncbi:MAG: NAD-dependent epimerase/dehydratase family protein [Myxococcaceae bacterium]|nr:NAD-dependent epimerase/dehydratase family protein [Myxococcaceae bacterium]MCI0672458.1 NAD-dependent epimerase/dehydratase family protein [Myxococcaceae bacterium]
MKTAFVTGGTGFVGQHVVEQAKAAGYDVIVFHRAGSNTRRLAHYAPTFAEGSLDSADSIASAMPEGCDAVFHVAGNTSFWSRDRKNLERDNVDGTRHMVEAALRRNVNRFVYTSSESAWGDPERQPLDETVRKRGDESFIDYDRTKFLAEVEVHRAIDRGLQAVIMNPAHVLGRYDDRSWGRAFRLVRDGAIPGVPPGSGSWTLGEEVGRAHVVAAEKGRVGDNYLLGGVDATYVEIFAEIAHLLGKKAPRALPAWVLKPYAHLADLGSRFTNRAPEITPELAHIGCEHRSVSSEKASKELGYKTAPIDVMLRDCFDWLMRERLI